MTLNTTTDSLKILTSSKLLIVFFGWITICFIHLSQQNILKGNEYDQFKKEFSLVDPYETPSDFSLLRNIEDLNNCTCPRVFFPACGENNDTYFNACVLRCLGETTLKRIGPCINYRRMNIDILSLKIPTVWKNPKAASLKPGEKLEEVLLVILEPSDKKSVNRLNNVISNHRYNKKSIMSRVDTPFGHSSS